MLTPSCHHSIPVSHNRSLSSGSCFLVSTSEAFAIGFFSALLCFLATKLMERSAIDDPVGAFAVHGVSGVWGLLAVGIFATKDDRIDVAKYDGLLRGELPFNCMGSDILDKGSGILYEAS